MVRTDEGGVYVAAIDFPDPNAGILEVRDSSDYNRSFREFRNDVQDNRSNVKHGGSAIAYETTDGDVITYENGKKRQNHATARVNGERFDWHGYALHDSPYCHADRGTGVITYWKHGSRLELRFNDRSRPYKEVQ